MEFLGMPGASRPKLVRVFALCRPDTASVKASFAPEVRLEPCQTLLCRAPGPSTDCQEIDCARMPAPPGGGQRAAPTPPFQTAVPGRGRETAPHATASR